MRQKNMRRRYRPAKLTNIGTLLQETLKKRGVPLPFADQHLTELWNKAVGPNIAAQTRPHSQKGDILFIKVSSSVWMQQLHFLKGEIIKKINRLLGNDSIKNIRFSVGEIPPLPSTQKEETSFSFSLSSLKDRDKKIIEQTTASLSDQELREMLKRLMKKEIARRRFMEKEGRKDH